MIAFLALALLSGSLALVICAVVSVLETQETRCLSCGGRLDRLELLEAGDYACRCDELHVRSGFARLSDFDGSNEDQGPALEVVE